MEQPKELRRIYMVSAALFGVASGVYSWMAPIGVALGLAVDLTEDKSKGNVYLLESAVERALDRTRESISSKSIQKIVDELGRFEIVPDNLGDLLEKTDTYQTQYCTEADKRDIINKFDAFFRDEVSKCESLSHLYILSNGLTTIEKLKAINDTLVLDDKKLAHIQSDVSEIKGKMSRLEHILMDVLSEITFVLISTALFLATGIVLQHDYDKIMIIVAPVCYGISSIMSYSLQRAGYVSCITKYIYKKSNVLRTRLIMAFEFVKNVYGSGLLTGCCFLIVYYAIGINRADMQTTIISIFVSSIVTSGLRLTKVKNTQYGQND